MTWFASNVQDTLAKGCLLLVAASLGFVGLKVEQMTSELVLTRRDFGRHTAGMYQRLDPTTRVMSEMAKPDPLSRSGAMMLFRYLEEYERIGEKLNSIEVKIDGMAKDQTQILELVTKGRKP